MNAGRDLAGQPVKPLSMGYSLLATSLGPGNTLSRAIDDLARRRTPYWLGDSAVRLHALASLIAQARQLLPQAVDEARDQELTWTQDRRTA